MAERIRQQIEQLMKANGNMEQKTLARRAKVSAGRVHRFLRGQMPYPPLSFLDQMLRVFGYTLPEALAASALPVKTPTPPSISRASVLEIAEELESWPEENLKAMQTFLRGFRPKRTKAR